MGKSVIRLNANSIDNQRHRCFLRTMEWTSDADRYARRVAFDAIAWWIDTGRSWLLWEKRFVNANSHTLMKTAACAARKSGNYSDIIIAVTNYLDRYYGYIA